MIRRNFGQVLRLAAPKLEMIPFTTLINSYSFSYYQTRNADIHEKKISRNFKQDLFQPNRPVSHEQSKANVRSLIKLCEQIINLKAQLSQQIPLFVQLIQLMKQRKRQNFETKQFTVLRELLNNIDFAQLVSLNLNELRAVGEYYLLAVEAQISKADQKYDKTIYEAFLNIVQQNNFKNVDREDLALYYKFFSKLNIIFPHLHNKVPKHAMLQIEKDNFTIEMLLNLTSGLSSRPCFINDERQLLLKIYKKFARLYKTVSKDYKIKIIKQILNLNALSRLGLSINEQQLILRSFLNEIQGGKHSVWQNQLYKLLKNDYEANHPIVSEIEEALISQIIDSIDSTGHMQTPLIDTRNQFEVFMQYSKKYAFERFDEQRQAKILCFFQQYLKNGQDKKEKELMKQYQLAIVVSNQFFKNQGEQLRKLIIDLKVKEFAPRLLYELSKVGVQLKYMQFMRNGERFEDMIKSLHSSQRIQSKQLLILMAAKIQSTINPQESHLQQIYDACCKALNKSANVNPSHLVHELLKLPQLTMQHLYELASFQNILPMMPKEIILSKYSSRNAFLYIVIKYRPWGCYQQIKPLLDKYLNDDLIAQILSYELKGNGITRTLNPLILSVLNTYVGQVFASNKSSFLSFMNVWRLLDYLTIITRQFKKQGQRYYQSATYYRYWQLVFTLLIHFDTISANLQWQLKFKTFISILLAPSNTHFCKTYEYSLFLKRSLGIVKKFKPNFEEMALIIEANIYYGHINERNFKEYTSEIDPKRDMSEQMAEIIRLWSLPSYQQSVFKAKNSLTKVINAHSSYSEEQFNEIREEVVKKFDFNRYLNILTSYNLPLNTQSRSFFLFLLTQFIENYGSRYSEINFVPILHNIGKYLHIHDHLSLFTSYGAVNSWLLEVLNHHSQHFCDYTLEYHAELIAFSAGFGSHNRDYETMLKSKIWEDINIQSKIIIITNLTKSDLKFNAQQLKKITQLMLTSQLSFIQIFLLLQHLFTQEVRHMLAKKILKEQKMLPFQLHLNNQLVHSYLQREYESLYHGSEFQNLKKDKTYQTEYSYCSLIDIRQQLKKISDSNQPLKYERGVILKNPFIKLGQDYIFTTNKRVSNAEKEFIRSLLANMIKRPKVAVTLLDVQLSAQFILERIKQFQKKQRSIEKR